ncbi:nucleotidyltransferase domain-containing protein [Candidatus Bathyarchaeota archaeon]|nr:nucleotidyltransferase domain-containing protein [Candidatus Bathyarchaeota archaeon]
MTQSEQLDHAKAFIAKTLSLAANVYQQHLISTYVFGGVAKGDFRRKISDVDLLFIVDDNCPDEITDRFEAKMERLEVEQGILPAETVDLLFLAFAYKTLLFKSHFTFRLTSLKHLDFNAMFSEGKGFRLTFWKILSRIVLPLGPSRLAIRNMLKEAKLLTGPDLFGDLVFPQIAGSETTRIFIASWLLSIFGIVSSVFSRSSTRFSLEAMKWYVLNVYSIFHEEASTVDRSLRFALANGLLPQSFAADRFVHLRKDCSYDLIFNSTLPIYLIVAQFQLIRHIRQQAHRD